MQDRDRMGATRATDLLFLDAHQAAVVEEAAARLIPGPSDEPAEEGHPGAREARVVDFIDRLLGAFQVEPPAIYAANTAASDEPARFHPLAASQRAAWVRRIKSLQAAYRDGIDLLDGLAGGDFTLVPNHVRDQVLAAERVAPFRDLLFEHSLQGMYSDPVYGGNRHRVGWIEIGYRGDADPEGFSEEEIGQAEPDVLEPSPIVADILSDIARAAQALGARRRHG